MVKTLPTYVRLIFRTLLTTIYENLCSPPLGKILGAALGMTDVTNRRYLGTEAGSHVASVDMMSNFEV